MCEDKTFFIMRYILKDKKTTFPDVLHMSTTVKSNPPYKLYESTDLHNSVGILKGSVQHFKHEGLKG